MSLAGLVLVTLLSGFTAHVMGRINTNQHMVIEHARIVGHPVMVERVAALTGDLQDVDEKIDEVRADVKELLKRTP